MRKLLVNHCSQGRYHMLDKIAYDYVTEIKTRGANVAKIKHELVEKVKNLLMKKKKY